MAGSLYESAFTLLIFIAVCVTELRFVEPTWTPPPPPAAVDCHCEPPPPPATITCPPPMPPKAPALLPPAPDPYSPLHPWFSPPTIVIYSSPPPPVSPDTPCDIPSPPQLRPWNNPTLPGLEFGSAESVLKSTLYTATLVTVIILFIG